MSTARVRSPHANHHQFVSIEVVTFGGGFVNGDGDGVVAMVERQFIVGEETPHDGIEVHPFVALLLFRVGELERHQPGPGLLLFVLFLIEHVLRDADEPPFTSNEEVHGHAVQHLHSTGLVISEGFEDGGDVSGVILRAEFFQFLIVVVAAHEEACLTDSTGEGGGEEPLLSHLVVHFPRFVLPIVGDGVSAGTELLFPEPGG